MGCICRGFHRWAAGLRIAIATINYRWYEATGNLARHWKARTPSGFREMTGWPSQETATCQCLLQRTAGGLRERWSNAPGYLFLGPTANGSRLRGMSGG